MVIRSFNRMTIKTNPIAQVLLDGTRRVARGRRLYEQLAIWKVYHTLIQPFTHSFVHYNLEGHDILLPTASRLPAVYSEFATYDRCLQSLSQMVGHKYPNAPIIDIGANIGDSVVLIRKVSDAPILAIEASPDYFSLLKHNTAAFGGITYVETFLGDGAVFSGSLKTELGSGGFVAGNGEIGSCSLVDVLAQNPAFATTRLLKIDTDGFDRKILKGALPWLRQQQPILFIEFDPVLDRQCGGPGLCIFDELRMAGYRYYVFFSAAGELMLVTESLDIIADLEKFFLHSHIRQYANLAAFTEGDGDLVQQIRQRVPSMPDARPE
jgi:FkbM family methyltransferase